MLANEHLVESVASAILEGTPIDWPAIEESASDNDRQILEELRLLCTVADLLRDFPAHEGAETWPDNTPDLRYWGRLRLIERVGGGSFGEVYRAWDPRLHREVALKLIPIAEPADHRRSTAILHEGRLLARVRHPGVVTIYDAERIGNQIGLCMEFVAGDTLAARLKRNGVFTPAETIAIGIQLCDALGAAHDAGVLHRDVKAANVVMKEDGRVVLMDFGAGTLDDGLSVGTAGTPLFVAPEVLDGRDATVASDIYSLGVLLDHLLTNGYLVQAKTVAELRQAHARRKPGQRIGPVAPQGPIPSRLSTVIARATHPTPARRYHTAAALGRELRALTAETPRTWVGRIAIAAGLTLAALAAVGIKVGWFGTGAGGPAARLVAESVEPVRIAILPFALDKDNETGQALQAGVTRDVIDRLQSFDNVRIISTASAFSAGSLDLPLREIASRLGATAILTGSLTTSAESVGVAVRLVNAADGRTLWERDYQPVAAPEASRAIAMDLARALGLHQPAKVVAWRTRNPEAFALYLRGRTEFDKFSPDGTARALKLLRAALQADPDYPDANALLGLVYMQRTLAIPAEEAKRLATEAVSRAMALDPELPEAYVAAAALKSEELDWAGADRDFQRAIELGPNNVHARQQYANWLSRLARHEEALEHAKMAESLDPMSTRAMMGVASAYRFAGRYNEAIKQAEKALAFDASHTTAYQNLGLSYQGLGRLDEAIAMYRKMNRPSGNFGHALAQAGYYDEARAMIAQYEKEFAKSGRNAGEIAQIYCGFPDVDKAMEWLLLAPAITGGHPLTFKVARVWDPLRSDPRFQALLKKYRLE